MMMLMMLIMQNDDNDDSAVEILLVMWMANMIMMVHGSVADEGDTDDNGGVGDDET